MIMKSFCLYCVINLFLCFHETVRNFDHHHMMQASLSLQKQFLTVGIMCCLEISFMFEVLKKNGLLDFVHPVRIKL